MFLHGTRAYSLRQMDLKVSWSSQQQENFVANCSADDNVTWPPPDPDRMARSRFKSAEEPFTYLDRSDDPQTRIEEFRRRQEEDLLRRRLVLSKKDPVLGPPESDSLDNAYFGPEEASETDDAESWTNGEGERLRDFGVDEDIDLDDEDNIPLGRLLEVRRQAAAAQRSGQ